MTTHVIGSNGHIGKRLLPHLDTVVKYSRSDAKDTIQIDLSDLSRFDFSRFSAGDFLIILAAISSLDLCEQNYAATYSVNVTGMRKLIDAALNNGANVLFFSSDAVNGNTGKAVFDENSIVSPFGKYAEMKFEIEQCFRANPNFKVFRLSYVFSIADKFTNHLLKSALSGKSFDAFSALYRNIVYIEDVVQAVVQLRRSFSKWDNCIFNISGGETLSRSQMAEIIKSEALSDLRINHVLPPSDFFETRVNIIATKSLYLSALLMREPTLFRQAVGTEFDRHNRSEGVF